MPRSPKGKSALATDLWPKTEHDRVMTLMAGELASSLQRIARAVTDEAMPGHDATGGTVISLTESVMGITAGLCRVAEAIGRVADALEGGRPR
jgi:hypothetical protein